MKSEQKHPCELCIKDAQCGDCVFNSFNTTCHTDQCRYHYDDMCVIGVADRCKMCSEYYNNIDDSDPGDETSEDEEDDVLSSADELLGSYE